MEIREIHASLQTATHATATPTTSVSHVDTGMNSPTWVRVAQASAEMVL